MTTTSFGDRLSERIASTSPICIGLEPAIDRLPEGVHASVDGAARFDRGMIDAVKDVAACVKPQLAHYECMGWEGMKLFWETCAYAKEQGLIVIADGKRGDIGSTCERYADAYLHEKSSIDALTVNPYLGSDGIAPFLERCEQNGKGIYVLTKTSNPSSGDLQDLPVGDEVVHEHMAHLVSSWGEPLIGEQSRLSSVGAVVGATYPEEMRYLRTSMPHTPFLIPGYGAQGGTADDVIEGFLANGKGALVSASRSVLYASNGKDWAEAAYKAALAMAGDIQEALEKRLKQ